MMVAVMAADAIAAPSNPTPVVTSPEPANSSAPPAPNAAPAQFTAKPIAAETVTALDSALSGSALSASTADAPLAAKPKIAAFNPDLSAFSLADVGAVMVTEGKKPAASIASTLDLRLADVGAAVSEAPKASKPEFSTSGLSLEPAAIVEKQRSSFVKNVDG
jgi:hypothetical protein